jgi:hypothetical protein
VDGSLDTPSSVASGHLRAGAEADFVEDPVDSVERSKYRLDC